MGEGERWSGNARPIQEWEYTYLESTESPSTLVPKPLKGLDVYRLSPPATLRNSPIVRVPGVLEFARAVPPCLAGPSILCPVARPSDLSEFTSFGVVVRCTVFSVVSLLALREGTLDFVASALQNGLCRFQSCEVGVTESVK